MLIVTACTVGLPALYVGVNSLIFLYLKWLVAPHPLLTEDEFISTVVGETSGYSTRSTRSQTTHLNLGVQTLANRTYFSRRDQLLDYSALLTDPSPPFRAVVMRVERSNRWTSRAFRTLLG